MMFKKCVGLVLAFAGFTFLVSINSAEAQAPCPSETCAVRCHSVGHIYDELSGSKMDEIHCSSCHLMGRIQEEQGLLEENEKEGFHILGHVTFSQGPPCEPEGHRIYDRKQVCVRCHHEDDDHHVQGKKEKDCCDCHMKIDGLTTYRVHVYKGEFFPTDPIITGPPESIFKFVTREHRLHTFEAKPGGTQTLIH